MTDATQDLYAQSSNRHYLRISGKYFRRVDGIGWQKCPESDLPDMSKFFPLHELQRAVYLPVLREAGLIK